jgi:hypothetical protein
MARDLEGLHSIYGRKLRYGNNGGLVSGGASIFEATPPVLWRRAPGFTNDPGVAFEFFDDFINPAGSAASDYHAYTSNDDAGTGTNVFQDVPGGVYSVVTAGVDNDYHAMSTVAENWTFAEGKELWFEARFKVAEATTNESTWWLGLTDTLTTGGMQANALGPLASYDGALIYKTPETAMTVNLEASNAGTQTNTSAFATVVTDTWSRAGFYFDGAATTSAITPFFHDGSDWTEGDAVALTLSGLEPMHAVFGIKAGPSGGAETLQMDYLRIVQLR